jgi:hypothetical protein
MMIECAMDALPPRVRIAEMGTAAKALYPPIYS